MSRFKNLLAGFTAATILVSGVLYASPGVAQDSFDYVKVTSCTTDVANNTLTFLTSSDNPLPAPVVGYLPGPGDETVMVADFAGVIWSGDAKITRLQRHSGIDEVRIGQFQENPPVCRISISSHRPTLFKSVTFKTSPGQVSVNWSTDPSTAMTASEQQQAAQRATQQPTLHPAHATATFRPVLPRPIQILSAASDRRLLPAPAPAYRDNTESASPINFLHRKPLTNKELGLEIDPAVRAKLEADSAAKLKQAQLARSGKPAPAPVKAPTPSPARAVAPIPVAQAEETAKGHSIFGKIFNLPSVEKVFNSKDRESHDKLTSVEHGNQQQAEQPARMKKQPSATVAMAEPNKAQFVAPTPIATQAIATQAAEKTNSDDVAAKNDGAAKKPVTGEKPKSPPISLELSSDETSVVDNLRVQISALKKINYKTFRMHDPERYIIDFDQLPELQTLSLPESDSPLYYRFRTGKLPANPNISRFVIDLPDASVSVADMYDATNNALVLLMTKELQIAKSGDTAEAPLSSDPPASAPPVMTTSTPSPIDPKTEAEATAAFNMPPMGRLKIPGALSIVLDAGHGGTDPGAQRDGVSEKDLTLQITQKLKKALEKQGADVIMTRSDDTFVSLEDRAKITNDNLPDLFLSVHINALESSSDIHGIETYFQTEQSKPLADFVHQSLVAGLIAPDRGVRKARFYVINHTSVPAVLSEVGFISNKTERAKMATPEYQQKIADLLARGVVVYLTKRPELKGLDRMQMGFSSPGKPLSQAGTTKLGTKSSTSNSPRGVSTLIKTVQ